MRPRFCACACNAARWARWACLLTRSEPANGFLWICSLAMMDCPKRCGCRNKRSWGTGRSCSASGRDTPMGVAALWGRLKPTDGADLKGREGPVGAWIARLKKGRVAVSESTQTLADGNHIARKTQTNLFRDSQGRFRKEVALPAIGPLATSGQPKSFVFINDPVAGTNFILHADTKTAEQMGRPFAGMKGPLKDALKGKMESRQQQEMANGNLKKEDLGTQTIAGVSAQGTRITHTIPAGQIGNEKAITIVSEHWYSNDLQTVVMSKRSDPRFGDTTYTLTNIQRSAPAASLFAVPSDYTVTQEGPSRHGMHMQKFNGMTDAPPPPPGI